MSPSARLPRLRFEGPVAWLSLEGLRVLDRSTQALLERHLAEVQARGDVERLVLHNPGPEFLVGVDTQWLVACIETDDFDAIVRFVEQGQRWLRTFDDVPFTTVAAVDGLATGAGAEWLSTLDAVVATARSRLGFPETGIGIYPALGGTQRLPRRVGIGAARWLILTGEYVSASAARSLGWVDLVVGEEALLDAARRVKPGRPRAARRPFASEADGIAAPLLRSFAHEPLERLLGDDQPDAEHVRAASRLRHRAPVALRLADQLVRASLRLPLREGLALEIESLAQVYATRDALTGLRASAAGRRAARFEGH